MDGHECGFLQEREERERGGGDRGRKRGRVILYAQELRGGWRDNKKGVEHQHQKHSGQTGNDYHNLRKQTR